MTLNWHQAQPGFAATAKFSRDVTKTIQVALQEAFAERPEVHCILATGSLARMEAQVGSDADFVIVVENDALADTKAIRDIVAIAYDIAGEAGLSPSNQNGIYAEATSLEALTTGPLGVVAEPVSLFGKRISLLLESAPMFRPVSADDLRRAILQRYASHRFANEPHQQWSYLVEELLRYWKSYRVWRRYGELAEGEQLSNRLQKLEHSRLISYASLLLACLEVTGPVNNGVERMLEWVRMMPLERLQLIAANRQQEAAYDVIVQLYDRFLQSLHRQPSLVGHEKSSGINGGSFISSDPALFEDADVDSLPSDGIRQALCRLLLARPETEQQDVLSSLLF